MTTRFKVILLAFILVFSSISSTVFAATVASTEGIKREVITRKLGNDSRKIYVIKSPIKDRNDLVKKYDKRKVDDIKKEVYYAKENENSKYTSAYNNMIKSYDYFNKNFGISSFGAKNSTLFVFPNFKLSEAFSGSINAGYLAFGEKNGKSYATALDVVGHEYTHLILTNKYKLDSQTKSSRTIHEGVADFFGSIIEGKDWKIGNSVGLTMRDLKNPTSVKLVDSKGNNGSYKATNGKKYSVYPNHYSKLCPEKDQSLGNYAYINSTIVSHLLYKIAEENKSNNKLGKIATGKLVLRALSKAPSKCTIEQFAKLLYTEAYSSEKSGVKASLSEMGLYKSVSSVKLDKTSLSIISGSSKSLKATVNPSDAFDKSVTWSTSNSKVATVDSKGVVKGVAPGTATITVTTKDGNKKATCKVTIDPYKSRSVKLKVSVPSSFKDKYYIEVLDDKNKAIYKSSTKSGSNSFNFTYTLNTTSQVHKRKVRITTTSKNKKSYTSNVFSIDKNTINKNITASYNKSKVSISQK